MTPKTVEQHDWLKKHFVGAWSFESSCPMGPEGEPVKSTGREKIRALGNTWIVVEGSGEMPGGGDCQWLSMLGYDPGRGVFVGNWAGSMMTHMFVYSGALDGAGRVLTLETEGPDMSDPTKTARYRDVHTIVSADERKLASSLLNEDGSWTQFMEGRFLRMKS